MLNIYSSLFLFKKILFPWLKNRNTKYHYKLIKHKLMIKGDFYYDK